MREPSEFDLAQLKHEMRQMYQYAGDEGAVQALQEMMLGAKLLAEVIMEERRKHETN